MFHHVPGQLVLSADDNLDDLVEVVGFDLESVQYPGERALRVVRVDNDLQTTREQSLLEHLVPEKDLQL